MLGENLCSRKANSDPYRCCLELASHYEVMRALGSHQRCMLSILVDHESCCAQKIWIVNHNLATARWLVQEAEDLALIKEQRRTPRRRGTLGL
jgi:hypothetical protein